MRKLIGLTAILATLALPAGASAQDDSLSLAPFKDLSGAKMRDAKSPVAKQAARMSAVDGWNNSLNQSRAATLRDVAQWRIDGSVPPAETPRHLTISEIESYYFDPCIPPNIVGATSAVFPTKEELQLVGQPVRDKALKRAQAHCDQVSVSKIKLEAR